AAHDRHSYADHANALAWVGAAWHLFSPPPGLFMPLSTAEKHRVFRALHERGCFVIPNPWNIGSARYLARLDFKARASTSAGFAHAQGLADGELTLEAMLTHFKELAAASDLPLNADFENGFAHEPDKVAENVTKCIATGVSGISIEDYCNDGT